MAIECGNEQGVGSRAARFYGSSQFMSGVVAPMSCAQRAALTTGKNRSTKRHHFLTILADLHGPQFCEECWIDLPPVRLRLPSEAQDSKGPKPARKKELARTLTFRARQRQRFQVNRAISARSESILRDPAIQ